MLQNWPGSAIDSLIINDPDINGNDIPYPNNAIRSFFADSAAL